MYDSKYFSINDTTGNGSNMFHLLAEQNNCSIMDEMIQLFPNCIESIDKPDNQQVTPLYLAAERNQIKAVKWFINKGKSDFNSNNPPILHAIATGYHEIASQLAPYTKSLELIDNIGDDLLDVAAAFGQCKILQIILDAEFTRYNVNTWDQMIQHNIVTEKRLLKWKQYGEKHDCPALLTFIYYLENKAFKNKNIDLVKAIIDPNWLNNEQFNQEWIHYRSSMKTAKYIYHEIKQKYPKHCKDVLRIIKDIINDGLLNQSCKFDDSLLILSKLCNETQFVQTMVTMATKCMSPKDNKEKHKSYWNTNVLASSIFCEKINEFEYKSDRDNSNEKTLCDILEVDTINKQLEKQQQFIKDSIIKMETTMNQDWYNIKQIPDFNIAFYGNIQQSTLGSLWKSRDGDLMNKYGVLSRYDTQTSNKELPCNGLNQFDAANIYDLNIYCSELITRAHIIQPYFQTELKKIFGDLYHEGNVKKLSRCYEKANNDYKSNEFPHSSYILDPIRASVVCQTPKQLFEQFNRLKILIDTKQAGVLFQIVRVKNTLKTLSSNITDLKKYRYGELQFLLQFMLDAKKIGHIFYSFLRKKRLYKQLTNRVRDQNFQSIKSMFTTYIVSKNTNMFFTVLMILTDKEISILKQTKNQKEIEQLISSNHWTKGLLLFNSFMIDSTN